MSKDFEIARLLVINECRAAGNSALAFAWANRLYPMFDDNPISREFEDDFRISKSKMQRVFDYLDEHEDDPETLGFWAIETHFGGKFNGDIDRAELIDICRYAYLNRRWESVWQHVVAPGVGPVESHGINQALEDWEISAF